MNKKSLLVITSTFPRWKNDTDPPFVFELCRRLDNHGFDVDVLAPHCNNSNKFEVLGSIKVHRYQYFFRKFELLAYQGGVLENLRKNKALYLLLPFFIISQAASIYVRLKHKRYDVIHAHWLIPQAFLCVLVLKLLPKKSRPRVICTSHGSDLLSLQSPILSFIKKWTLQRLDGITVVSNHMRKACLELISTDRNIHVLPMGVDLKDRFIPIEDVETKSNRIIFVGRLIKNKGVLFLLEAIKIISIEMPDINLLIIGDGPDRELFEKKCNTLGIERLVEFYGSISQHKIPTLLRSAEIAVIPSIKEEGLGLVAIEAMGCGCAVIMSCLKAAEEFINNNDNGILVKPGDTEALVKAIRSLLLDSTKREQIASKGRQSVVEKFDWNVISKKYAEILELSSR